MKKVLFGIMALVLSTSIYAATGDSSVRKMEKHPAFSRLDTNHDGYIDKNEANADKSLATSFDHLAASGKLDKKAYNAWRKPTAVN